MSSVAKYCRVGKAKRAHHFFAATELWAVGTLCFAHPTKLARAAAQAS